MTWLVEKFKTDIPPNIYTIALTLSDIGKKMKYIQLFPLSDQI